VDDAAFSIAGVLKQLAANGHPIVIVNCFTDTRFAPYRPGIEGDVPNIRREEDLAFARSLGGECTIVELGFRDALLRGGIRSVILPHGDGAGVETAIAELEDRLPEESQSNVVFAPLGIGFHADHVIACRAAIATYGGHALAFYEDLPYAGSAGEEAIVVRADTVSRALGIALSPQLVHSADGLAFKESACLHYRSQIGPAGIGKILDYWKKIGGERLWSTPAFAARIALD
jgi:LmbE family N-acetylglucosaminyl deacetylase